MEADHQSIASHLEREVIRLRAALEEARKMASRAGPQDQILALNQIEDLARRALNGTT